MYQKNYSDSAHPVLRTYADTVLCTALDVGQGLLRSGAEIYRVEDTIERICYAYGAEHVEVFAITSVITASLRMPDGEHSSQMRRVRQSANDLGQLELFNELSREICRSTPAQDEVQKRIAAIKAERGKHPWFVLLGGMISAGGFAILFGGNWLDGIAAALIGFWIVFLGGFIERHSGSFFKTLTMSLLGGFLAEALTFTPLDIHADKIMIGVIMLLVPGIALGNSIRDFFSGDVVAGSARLMNSIMIAVVIAFGFSVATLLLGGLAV